MPPAVARCRVAVRQALRGLTTADHHGDLVLVACSGGADSLALAAAAGFVGPRLRLRVGLVTIDHGLQPGSAQRADQIAQWARDAGLAPVLVRRVEVAGLPGGPEAAARHARYAALTEEAAAHQAAAVLLGHTLEDQAETVLLALARGGGLRGLAAMPPSRRLDGVRLLRPLLAVSRSQTRQCCESLGLDAWQDPHNVDPVYARARIRAALPLLVEALGPGVVANLARTAQLAAADAALLDELAAMATVQAAQPAHDPALGGLSVAVLDSLPAALRTRVLRRYAHELGAPAGALAYAHVAALDALVTAWHGQGPVSLPGGGQVGRRGGRIEGLHAPDRATPAGHR